MAKLFASETAFEVATEAMRIHGGVGYTTELPVERYLAPTSTEGATFTTVELKTNFLGSAAAG